MSTKGLWDNDFDTVGDLIAHLQQFDKNTRVYVSTSAGGGITASLRETDKNERVVCFYGKNGGSVFNDPLTDEYYNNRKDDLLRYLSDRKYKCVTKYHGGKCVVYKLEGVTGTFEFDRINKIVIDRMRSEGILSEFDI